MKQERNSESIGRDYKHKTKVKIAAIGPQLAKTKKYYYL